MNNLISIKNNRLILTQSQLNDYLDKKIDRFYIPLTPDQEIKTPYISRDCEIFTWSYDVLLARGYKTKYSESRFKLRYDFNKNIMPVSIILDKTAIDARTQKAYREGIKFKSYDCIRPTIENELSFRNNWYWEIIV